MKHFYKIISKLSFQNRMEIMILVQHRGNYLSYLFEHMYCILIKSPHKILFIKYLLVFIL